MDVGPGLQIRWAVVHVEAIRHASAEFSHEEWIAQMRGERNCCLECGGWKAPTTESNAGHGCRRGPNDINRDNRIAIIVVVHAFGEAVDHDCLTQLLPLTFETRTGRP